MNETNQMAEVRFLTGKTVAQRQAAYREKRERQGLVPVTVFVPASTAADWKAAAAVACEKFTQAERENWLPILRNQKTGHVSKGF
jgi:hypothetical protein